jgi:hypothetical protein
VTGYPDNDLHGFLHPTQANTDTLKQAMTSPFTCDATYPTHLRKSCEIKYEIKSHHHHGSYLAHPFFRVK